MLNSLITNTMNHCHQLVKDRLVFIREGRNELECRTIHSRAGKQTSKYKNWLNIINEKENTENIDWKSIKSWKRDSREYDSFHFTKSYERERN